MKQTLAIFLGFALLVISFTSTLGQKNDTQEITQVISTLFKGMYEADSSLVRSLFTKSVSTATVFRDKSGISTLKQDASIINFLNAIGTPRKEKWSEEFWGLKINIDGDLAQVWCDYAFYRDHTLSHCGVDAFQLHRTALGWKIFTLVDTRRIEPCNIPDSIKTKHQTK